MLQAGQPYPIILNSLNLVVCIRGSLPEIKLANTTKNLILNQLLQDQSKLTQVKSIGFEDSLVKLPNTLLTSFKDLKDSLVRAKTEGATMVFIKSIQDIKVDTGSFSENMNKIVNELIDLSKTFELTLVVGVDITKLENVPPYALNKKANLWVIEDRDRNTSMNHNRNRQSNYNVDFDPHTGISFELSQKTEITFNNDKEIVAMKEELNVLSNELQGLLGKEIPLENLTQLSKKVSQVSESLIHKIRQQIKLKDLIEEGQISLEDKLIVSHKGNNYQLEMSLESGEVVLKDNSGATYKTPSGAASTILGRSANGWNEIQVVDKDGNSKGDLLGLREVLVSKRATYKLVVVQPVVVKEFSIPEKILVIFNKPSNKGKMLDYLEMHQEINKYFSGTCKGQTPEATVSAILSTMAKEGLIKVAKPSGSKSRYYI